MRNFSKKFGLSDLALGVIVIIVLTFLVAISLFPKIIASVFSSKCEIETRQNIQDLETRAVQADLSNAPADGQFKFDDSCVGFISSDSSGNSFIKFRSQNEKIKLGDGVKFKVENGLITYSGTYKVKITANKVEITNEKVPE